MIVSYTLFRPIIVANQTDPKEERGRHSKSEPYDLQNVTAAVVVVYYCYSCYVVGNGSTSSCFVVGGGIWLRDVARLRQIVPTVSLVWYHPTYHGTGELVSGPISLPTGGPNGRTVSSRAVGNDDVVCDRARHAPSTATLSGTLCVRPRSGETATATSTVG